jgi:hypothetical protein
LNHWRLGILDRPPEPVIGRRNAPTRWRAMTAESVLRFGSPRTTTGFEIVIASAAKQSIFRFAAAMDCFAALAMTLM